MEKTVAKFPLFCLNNNFSYKRIYPKTKESKQSGKKKQSLINKQWKEITIFPQAELLFSYPYLTQLFFSFFSPQYWVRTDQFVEGGEASKKERTISNSLLPVLSQLYLSLSMLTSPWFILSFHIFLLWKRPYFMLCSLNLLSN